MCYLRLSCTEGRIGQLGGGGGVSRTVHEQKKTANHGSRLSKFHVQVCPTCKICKEISRLLQLEKKPKKLTSTPYLIAHALSQDFLFFFYLVSKGKHEIQWGFFLLPVSHRHFLCVKTTVMNLYFQFRATDDIRNCLISLPLTHFLQIDQPESTGISYVKFSMQVRVVIFKINKNMQKVQLRGTP